MSLFTHVKDDADIHMVPLNTIASMFPFFKPNFKRITEYWEKCNGRYKNVLAIVPTGWTMTNRFKNKFSEFLKISVKLFPYSEHSSKSELQSFVSFLNPKKVVRYM
eukprot:GHVL01029370.1.p1 GENE.GHVL01029370.1~~GHVL01029370.1.p1  ORF type:complete len:106 (+),score=11.34 GHVL01029370.1:140-457(+)